MNQKLLHMANDIKSNAKLGFEKSYIQFENWLVSTEPFEGYDNVIENNRVLWLCQDGALDIDSNELIDRIVIELESMEKGGNQ
jgi:hypothetical protein